MTLGSIYSASLLDAVTADMNRAVAEEREACARAAEKVVDKEGSSLINSTAEAVAKLIREREVLWPTRPKS